MQHGFAVALERHVDKVDDDDAAEVAQAQFAGDGVAGFEVGFENGFVEIARAHKAAGVYINSGHGFGGFDNQIAAEIEVDARLQGAVDFLLDVVGFKQGALALEKLDFIHRALHILAGKFAHAQIIFGGIDQNFAGVVVKHIAQHAQGQRQVLIKQGFGRARFGLVADVRPHFGEVVDIGLQFGIGGGFGAGADDVAVAGIGG